MPHKLRPCAQSALEAARRDNIHALSVVVTDPGGVLRVAMRADKAGLFGIDIATAKATTALGFNTSSLKLSKTIGGNPAATAALTAATHGRFLPIGGGVLIHDMTGAIIGAAAAAGSAPEDDERLIIEGIVTAGLATPHLG
jgi:uncharacterized protein GlcG (DUF336 family)